MKNILLIFIAATAGILLAGCRNDNKTSAIRQPVDTIGFAQYSWQVDSLISRISHTQSGLLREAGKTFPDDSTHLRLAISPHDDYSYVGYLYPALFKHVRSQVIIMFGVAHKAKNFNLEDRIVFGSGQPWKSPKGKVNISCLQEKIIRELHGDLFVVKDSMINAEHSLEALIPFIEYYNQGAEIIPVLVPYMSFERIDSISSALAPAIKKAMDDAGLEWGKGYSIIISSDAVHYGNEEWGGKNYDRFGVDSAGYTKAVCYEKQIISDCLEGTASPERIRLFFNYTVSSSDYHDYIWTWCGRYSIPLGMLTALKLSETEGRALYGKRVGYSTSIENDTIRVHDIGMGRTAPARLAHWVGYAAVGFE